MKTLFIAVLALASLGGCKKAHDPMALKEGVAEALEKADEQLCGKELDVYGRKGCEECVAEQFNGTMGCINECPKGAKREGCSRACIEAVRGDVKSCTGPRAHALLDYDRMLKTAQQYREKRGE